jgi:hypothetical protein
MQTVEKYYSDFHDYLCNTRIEKMSFKKLDKFVNILYYDWPVSMSDLYAFVEYRSSQAKKIDISENSNDIQKDPKYLPCLSPEKVFNIYGLSNYFRIGSRGWCGHRYTIYSVNENNRVIEEKIEYINQLITVMEKFRQIHNNGDINREIMDVDILDLYRLFNKVFLNMKNFRSIIPREKFGRLYDRFNVEKTVYEKEYLNIITMRPEKVIKKYNLDKLFKIKRGEYPVFDWIFILRNQGE